MLLKEKLEKVLNYAVGKPTKVIRSKDLRPEEVLSLDFKVKIGDKDCNVAIRKSVNGASIVKGSGFLSNVQGAEIFITYGPKKVNQVILLFTDNKGNNIFPDSPDGPCGFVFCPLRENPGALDAKLLLLAKHENYHTCVIAKSYTSSKHSDNLLTLGYNDLENLSEAYDMLLLACDVNIREFYNPEQNLLPDNLEKLLGYKNEDV